jgi:regulator of sigma E protease
LPLATWAEWVEFIRANPGKDVMLTIERDGRNTDMTLLIGELTAEDGSIIGRIGAGPEVADGFYDQYLSRQQYPVFDALRAGVDRTWAMSMLTVKMVSRIVTGDVSVKNISGPINIAQVAGYSASIGLSSFLNFLAVVSLSLGILNLLPIPILDGGQVVYQILEAIKGSPLSMRVQLIGQQVGIVLLIIVMGFAFYNDLSRVFS